TPETVMSSSEQNSVALVLLDRDTPDLGDGVLERDQFDLRRAQCRHRPPLALMGRIDRRQPEPRCQHAVEGGRTPAALDVPEYGRARLVPGSLLDLALERVADPAQPWMPELVHLPGRNGHRSLLGHRAFGGYDDREVTPASV